MDKEKITKLPLIVTYNKSNFKNFKNHNHCHVHYKEYILNIINCKTQHTKFLVASTAILKNGKLVDFHWENTVSYI